MAENILSDTVKPKPGFKGGDPVGGPGPKPEPAWLKSSECDKYCEDQFTPALRKKTETRLKSCVAYFVDQCQGPAKIQGAYGKKGHTVKGEWNTVYGICRENKGGD